MAFPTIPTPANSQHRTAGIQAVFIRPSTELYQTLGGIMGGVLNIKLNSSPDSQKRNKTNNTYEVTAQVKMKQTSLVELELLDTIVAGTSAFLFKLSDAGAIPSNAAVTEGWMVFSSSQIGCTAAPDLSGTAKDNRTVTLNFKGTLKSSELDAAVKASIDDNEFEATGGTGTLKSIGTYTAALDGGNPTPASNRTGGVSSITLAYAGGVAQTLGPVKNFKLTFNPIADEDSLGIPRQHGYDVMCEYDWPLTDATNLLNLDSMHTSDIDAVVTMLDGVVVTLSNKLGIETNFESAGDYDKERVVRFTHNGTITLSQFDGIVS